LHLFTAKEPNLNVLSSPRTAQGASQNGSRKPLIENLAMAFGVGVPFLGLLGAIYLFWGRGVGMVEIGLLVGFYSLSILGVTVGFHRMFTHRALESGPVVRFLLAAAGSMSAQGPVLEWCAVHRQHHKHSDREGDPHSPHLFGEGVFALFKGMIHSHMGWLFKAEPAGVANAVPDLVADPVLRFADRFFWVWMLGGWVVPGAIAYAIHPTWQAAGGGFIWGGLVRTFLLHHVTWSINSVCHVWGRRPFNTPDESRNNPIFGLLAFGEGWHNNHHAFPTSARHGLFWYQIDLTWLTIRVLRALGLVRNVRLVSQAALESRLGGAAVATPASQPS
jgi:stearoyl-CoA desaturase (delta-9 desaturase)